MEGYKYLQEDPNNATNDILRHISIQLAAMAEASPVNKSLSDTPTDPFHVAASVVRFNAFWFLSLAFSLSCALSATLVQQWSRYYLQAIERRSAPHHRARIRSYLHEGIIIFKMTSVVETIPVLLHISVFLFFAGLVEFLMPINTIIANLTLGAASVCGALYLIITILPIPYRQCPYRTPISGMLWRGIQCFYFFKHRILDGVYSGNLADSREFLATSGVPGKRDKNALQWVLDSLTENSTLEAFVGGIPGFFHSDKRDLGYDPGEIFDSFLREGHIDLGFKIGRLLKSCGSGALTRAASQRRALTCLNAISILTLRLSDKSISSWMQGAWLTGFVDCIAEELQRLKKDSSPVVASCAHYTFALMAYKWQREFLVTVMKDMDFGSQADGTYPPATGSKAETLASVLGVLDKLQAVRMMEEATDLKIMPGRGVGDIHALMANVWELRKMLRNQASPSLMCKQILGMSRVSALINFVHLLQERPPETDEAHSMAFDILCVMAGHYSGTLRGVQDRHDLLTIGDVTKLLMVKVAGEAIGSNHRIKKSSLPQRICDVLVWLVASLENETTAEDVERIIRGYQLAQPDSRAAQLTAELYRLRAGGMSQDDSVKWMNFYQARILPESEGPKRI